MGQKEYVSTIVLLSIAMLFTLILIANLVFADKNVWGLKVTEPTNSTLEVKDNPGFQNTNHYNPQAQK